VEETQKSILETPFSHVCDVIRPVIIPECVFTILIKEEMDMIYLANYEDYNDGDRWRCNVDITGMMEC
jgi:hypothetical protein